MDQNLLLLGVIITYLVFDFIDFHRKQSTIRAMRMDLKKAQEELSEIRKQNDGMIANLKQAEQIRLADEYWKDK